MAQKFDVISELYDRACLEQLTTLRRLGFNFWRNGNSR